MTNSIGVYLYDEVEVLDFAGPFEVFSTASRVKHRRDPKAGRAFDVLTIGDSARMIRARGGLMIQPMVDIAAHPPLDVLIVPGGVVTAELERVEISDWIARVAATATITASVCTGAFLLGKAGVLRPNEAVTTHWEDIPELRAMFPELQVRAEARWVDSGRVVTSAGISAGLDMSLHLVERLEDEDLAVRTARQMEYEWNRG
jgi:transcriptional regulator GlxA family with amidase domain